MHWDQRGTGSSFNDSLNESDVSFNKILDDANQLTEILKTRFNQSKIFIIGHSFPENKELVLQYNCPFKEFGPNYRELFKKNAQIKGGFTVAPSPKEMKFQIQNQIDILPGIIEGSDLVLGVHTVANILKIPYRFVIFP